MNKKALILGAGSAQIDIIRYLKGEGWWVLACSNQQHGKVLNLVDRFELIDIRDSDALESLAREEDVSLVYSIGSDIAVPSITKVSHNLGLPTFIEPETSKLLSNKFLLRNFLADNMLSPVKYKKICTREDITAWEIFPCIIKPVDSQGQRGIYIAHSDKEIEAGLSQALNYSDSKTLIAEEYLDGPEFSVTAFIVNSRVIFCQISDRLVVEEYSAGIPRAHKIPSKMSDKQHKQTTELVDRCITALKIENGPIYFQLKITRKGPRIIEITPRLDGCHLWRLIKLSGGPDLLEASVNLLTRGYTPEPQNKIINSGYTLEFFLCPPDREFKKADYQARGNTIYIEFYYRDGDVIRPINGMIEKVGYYIVAEK